MLEKHQQQSQRTWSSFSKRRVWRDLTLPNQCDSHKRFMVMWSGRDSLLNNIWTCGDTNRRHSSPEATTRSVSHDALGRDEWPTCCFSTFSRWQRTLRRCLTSARTEQRTNFCCGDKTSDSGWAAPRDGRRNARGKRVTCCTVTRRLRTK